MILDYCSLTCYYSKIHPITSEDRRAQPKDVPKILNDYFNIENLEITRGLLEIFS